MKVIFLLCAYMNSIFARPQDPIPKPEILGQNFTVTDDGGFFFTFRTSDGFTHSAQGELKNMGTPKEGLSVKGTYSYILKNGSLYNVRYTADERGFNPVVRILPISVKRIGDSCVSSLCGTGLG